MACERYADTDTAERYVAGAMTHGEEAEFEQHFLACDECLALVRGVEDVRDALLAARATRQPAVVVPMPPPAARARSVPPHVPYRVPRWVWAAAAAAVIGALWLRAVAPSPDHPAIVQNQPSAQPGSDPRRTPPAPPVPAPAVPSPPSLAELIAPLAIVTPPPYIPVPVRGDAPSTARAFEAAMARYRTGDYAGAAEGLRAVVAQAPDSVPGQFFLGIAELMQKRPEQAEAALRRVVASGETPFADEAHFYLAKAALQRSDLVAAERELAEAVKLDAGPNDDARTLLERVRALRGARVN